MLYFFHENTSQYDTYISKYLSHSIELMVYMQLHKTWEESIIYQIYFTIRSFYFI